MSQWILRGHGRVAGSVAAGLFDFFGIKGFGTVMVVAVGVTVVVVEVLVEAMEVLVEVMVLVVVMEEVVVQVEEVEVMAVLVTMVDVMVLVVVMEEVAVVVMEEVAVTDFIRRRLCVRSCSVGFCAFHSSFPRGWDCYRSIVLLGSRQVFCLRIYSK